MVGVGDSAAGAVAPDWPRTLTADAWTGTGAATGEPAAAAGTWAVDDHFEGAPESFLHAEKRPDLADHLDHRVGWALVLPDRADVPLRERHRADDAPDAARRLAAARSPSGEPVVLRHQAGDLDHLYRYLPDGTQVPLPTTGEGHRGTGVGALPRYLMLLGPPADLPWELQFRLNHVCFTGRLDLDDVGLGHYVEAALSDWAGELTDATSPLLWTAEIGHGEDITTLMRAVVGTPTLEQWRSDTQIGDRAVDLAGASATCGGLAEALGERRPGVVVTTSHGATGPLTEPTAMRATLGRLVDTAQDLLDPAALLRSWQPDGVVWYALACCSAGGSGRNQFVDLLDGGSTVGRTMSAVADLGPVTAELPRALLGAERPARAFVGHVEPTFDWTLRRPDTGVSATASVVDALYGSFFQMRPPPVGLCFAEYFREGASLRSAWMTARNAVEVTPAARGRALLAALTGIDRQCTVILGDPCVAPRALPPQ